MIDDPWDSDSCKTAIHQMRPADLLVFSHPPSLELVRGPNAPKNLVLDRDAVTVGRGTACDFQLDSPDLSRLHFSLSRRGTDWVCQDLDSANGVYLNGLKVHSAVLRNGDRLQVGAVLLVFHEGG